LSEAYNYMRIKKGIINTMQNMRDTKQLVIIS